MGLSQKRITGRSFKLGVDLDTTKHFSGGEGAAAQQKPLDMKEIQGLTLERIVYITNEVGMKLVEARKKAERLELLKPSYRARAMERYDDGVLSETKIRRLAEIDVEYIKFIEALAQAKADCDKLRVRYDSYKNLFEAKRSMMSYQKAEMKLL